MMKHRLRGDLLKRRTNQVSVIENDSINIATIDIFEEKNTKILPKGIDGYIREFDFEVHLDNLQGIEIPTSAIFIKGDTNTSILNAYVFKSNIPVNLSNVIVR